MSRKANQKKTKRTWREFLKQAGQGAALFAMLSVAGCTGQQAIGDDVLHKKEGITNNGGDNRPNILFIMTDQQRFDSLGSYGCKAARTPNLDLMAKQGVVFENCVVNNAMCTPSRASIWTGKELPGHGVLQQLDGLPLDEVFFSKHLQDNGYYTGLFGKLQPSNEIVSDGHGGQTVDMLMRRHPNDGFDEYELAQSPGQGMDVPYPYHAYSGWLKSRNPALWERVNKDGWGVKHIPREFHMTHWAAERTIDFINRASKKQQPFFATMSVFDPHEPYDIGPESYTERIDPNEIEPTVTSPFSKRPRAHLRSSQDPYTGAVNIAKFSEEDIIERRRQYHGSIAMIDDEVGRVLEALEASGTAKNTLVIFTSDHGDILDDHQLSHKGAFFYDPVVKVPLIMRLPESFPVNKRISSMVQNNDIAATCLAVAGCADKSPSDSRNLLPVIHNKVPSVREYAICRYPNTTYTYDASTKTIGYWDPPENGIMLRTEEWKVTVYENDEQGELYHLTTDPKELNNLWNSLKHAQIQKRLLNLIDENGGILKGETSAFKLNIH